MDLQPFDFPDVGIFTTSEFAKAPMLTRRVVRMIGENDDFAHLRGYWIPVVWKAGKSKKLGQCEKVKGTLAAFVPRSAPFVITVYYDMVRMLGFTEHQMDALLDHELRHCGFDQNGLPIIIQHDVEEFCGTVERYGLWFEDVRRFAELCERVSQ